MMSRFWRGFSFVWRGFTLVCTTPALWLWTVFPFVLSVLLFIFGIFVASNYLGVYASQTTTLMMSAFDAPSLHFLFYPLLILFWLAFFLLQAVLLYLVASILSAPFYAVMAEKILRAKRVLPESHLNLRQLLQLSIRMLRLSVIRGALFASIGVLLFGLSFIPGINLITSYFMFILLACDAADYAHEALGQGLPARLQYFRSHLPEYFGMGAAVGLTVLVPGLILLVMPFAVVGAAELVGEYESSGTNP